MKANLIISAVQSGSGKTTPSLGVIISILFHLLILSAPLSTAIVTPLVQGSGEIELSIIQSDKDRDPETGKKVRPKVEKVRVLGKETTRETEVREGRRAEKALSKGERIRPAATEKEPDIRVGGETKARAETAPGLLEDGDAEARVTAEAVEGIEVNKQQVQTEGISTGPMESGYAAIAEDIVKQDPLQGGVSSESARAAVFGDVDGPRFLRRVLPSYPLLARRLGREGSVVLKLSIDETGRLVDVEVIEKAGFGFDRAAVEAVKKSTFLPAKRNGKPVRSEALLSVKFVLKRE